MARVLISMEDAFLAVVDKTAQQEHRSRSELIREALRSYIRRAGVQGNPLAYQQAQQQAQALEALLGD